MRKILPILYKLMFVFIPLHLFFDFGSLSFFYIHIDDYNSLLDSPRIPMPIGGIAFFLATLIGYLCSILSPSRFKSILSPSKLFQFYIFVVLPISLYTLFVSNISITRLLQLILPMTFISLLSFPIHAKDRIDIFKVTFISSAVYFTLHFLSIVTTAINPLNIDPYRDFSSFFGIVLYQSLVTYPAAISLYLFLTLAFIYVSKRKIIPNMAIYRLLSYGYIFILLYLLAASGRRAFLVEFTVAFTIIIISSVVHSLRFRYAKKITFMYFFLFIMLFMLFFTWYVNVPLSSRVLNSVENNTFDSGRVDILSNAFKFYTNNLDVLLVGGGTKDVPGFHNFVLDQIYRVGIIGLVSVYAVTVLLVRRFVRVTDLGTAFKAQRRTFILIMLSCLFLQSMINASVSQPYYFVNFLVVTILIFFVLFSQVTTRSSSSINQR